MARKLFCEINPTCYKISKQKEIMKRHLKDALHKEKYACSFGDPLPCLVHQHQSLIVRRLHGVDLTLQENKYVNLQIALQTINGLIIHPGEVFSFWHCVGKTDRKKGYLPGLVIRNHRIDQDIGGGLCQLSNMIHQLVLHSPLTVTELHHHSDALFPDEKRRVPFGTGTSISYNNRDYRFQNTTAQDVQLILFIAGDDLHGELRATHPFDEHYELLEEDQYFQKEADGYYRHSKVYRLIYRDDTCVKKELILNNHSKVMYDENLIPKDQIKKKST